MSAAAAGARLDHVGLSVADLDAEIAFYEAAFAFAVELTFTLGDDGTRGAMLLHPSGGRLELFERPGAAPGRHGLMPLEMLDARGYGHVALATPQLDVLYAEALRAGATAKVPPQPSPEPGVRFAFVADPEGHLVELVGRAA
ncbi:MAG TPA: VOC family protein [Solirubrobacteraceae bacterium]|nr:VOC family protein [Solirubrobacteraceae bacterium]